ncbi:endonuclease domain-containing protein [Sphingosinicella sp. LHD-64]|uniref:endonuclease domain-containing protein n=1 Tax=Sphingosinicella sp. LHD-64 TaxID=3072139 RepID=UPI00280ED21E|nr:endonuclease domain-containing protein [Sphingosinicella sp. LHD-64]MDQ8756314.1 endonuclease domain-containing protein [Sphingosinicella sp. LHD-64]
MSPSPLAGEGLGRGQGSHPTPKLLRTRAKAMRSAPTDAERKLWDLLRAKRLSEYKFKRQVPIDNYIVDFACLRQRLIVEADGGQHDASSDASRDIYLRSQGFRILRFWNNDILTNKEGVTQRILEALVSPLPNPSPAEGRGA